MTTSVIPTPASPDVCSYRLLIDGSEVSGEFQVLSVTVSNELNRIPSASVQLRDGEAARRTFPASDTGHFVPGKQIQLELGYRGETRSVFKGIVVKHRVRVRKDATLLWLECRDQAVRMTMARRSRYYLDTTDGDLLDELIGGYGLERSVAATTPTLREVVQYDSTDWDFLVCRAESNGHVVGVRDGRIAVGPPDVTAEPVVSTEFGTTVLELDAEIDARWQAPGITTTTWSPTDQALVSIDAAEPAVTGSGDLAASDLAEVIGGGAQVLRHGGWLSEPELQAWADGRLLKDRLAKVRGRVRFQGFGGVAPGDVIAVQGVGTRVSGPQLVTGVRHSFGNGNWETDVAFGIEPEPFAAAHPVTAIAAGGMVPAINGLQIGIVTALQDDPDGEDRIRVRLPLVSDSEDGVWARLGTLDAGSGRGTYFRPEIDDEVVVGFIDADPRFPIVLGQCHSSAKAAPEPGSDDNHRKGYVSRSKLTLTFDDEKKSIAVETPGGNRLTLSDDEKSIALADQHGNSITLDENGITLRSAKDVVVEASGDVTVQGKGLDLSAQAGFKAGGQSGTDITSSGTLTIKGSLVQIN